MSAQEIRVPVPGGEIVGHVYGDHGPDVILVPSVGGSEAAWQHTAELLSSDCRVVTFALRGHGQSTCELGDDLEEVLRDVVALADHVGMARPTLVAYGFGGAVASMAAARFPGRFAALGVFDSPLELPTEEYGELLGLFAASEVLPDLEERVGLGMSGPDRASFEAYVAEYAHRLSDDWLGKWPSEEHAQRVLLADTLVDDSGAWIRRPDAETCRRYADIPEDFFAHPGRELLPTLGIPVWIIQPERGHYATEIDAMRELADAHPGWWVREVPGSVDALLRDEVAEELRHGLHQL